MIRRVTVRNFKRFEEQTFELADSVVLAGPNNAGKSTLLQAIATWKMGIARWAARRGAGKAVKRSGVSITRGELTATPLREMNLLWRDRQVTRTTKEGRPPGTPRLIEIVIEGSGTAAGRAGDAGAAAVAGEVVEEPWECGLEFQYANPEMVYVRPCGAKQLDSESIRDFPPAQAADLLRPEAVGRFVGLPLHRELVRRAFDRQVPVGTDYFGDHPALSRVKASNEFLVPLLEEVGAPTPKRDLFLLGRRHETRGDSPRGDRESGRDRKDAQSSGERVVTGCYRATDSRMCGTSVVQPPSTMEKEA